MDKAIEAAIQAHVDYWSENAPSEPGEGKKVEFFAMQAAIAAHQAASGEGWQPIETAPKDGTVVLLYREIKPWRVVGFGHWYHGGDIASGWLSRGFYEPPGNLGLGAPTAWRPLPAPPDIAAREGE